MRGRKPKPTALKVLAGNPGRRPLPAGEPAVQGGVPRAPRAMSREARAEWRRVMRHYAATGVITQVDRPALVAYCELYARAREAERKLQQTGLLVITDKGQAFANPLIRVADRAWAEMRAFAIEFGMTPSSRARVRVPDKVPEDEFTQYMHSRVRVLGKGQS